MACLGAGDGPGICGESRFIYRPVGAPQYKAKFVLKSHVSSLCDTPFPS